MNSLLPAGGTYEDTFNNGYSQVIGHTGLQGGNSHGKTEIGPSGTSGITYSIGEPKKKGKPIKIPFWQKLGKYDKRRPLR